MDMRQLQRFVVVAENGSFNRAAEALAVSQPSLTRSIQLLEEIVGGLLFERSPRGIELTETGRELLPRARLILAERDRALTQVRALHGRSAQAIAVGTDLSFSVQRLPQALARLAVSHPLVQVTVREGSLSETLDLLRDGRLNLVLGARGPLVEADDLEFTQIAIESAGVILRADHPLARSRGVRVHDLVAERWIVPDHPALEQGWRRIFSDADLPVPSVALRTSSLNVIKGCLLAGQFVSLGDKGSFADEITAGRLVFCPTGVAPYERPIGVFWRPSSKLTDAERHLAASLQGT